jgi:hypothetical protein
MFYLSIQKFVRMGLVAGVVKGYILPEMILPSFPIKKPLVYFEILLGLS